MTQREIERLEKLKAKADKEAKEERAFLKKADQRKADLLYRWQCEPDSKSGIEIQLESIAGMYGCSVEELLGYISTQTQIQYYQRTHKI